MAEMSALAKQLEVTTFYRVNKDKFHVSTYQSPLRLTRIDMKIPIIFLLSP